MTVTLLTSPQEIRTRARRAQTGPRSPALEIPSAPTGVSTGSLAHYSMSALAGGVLASATAGAIGARPRPGGDAVTGILASATADAISGILASATAGAIPTETTLEALAGSFPRTGAGGIPAMTTLWEEALAPSRPPEPSTNLPSVCVVAAGFSALISTTADPPRPPAWLYAVIRRLEQVLSLPADWDTYGASAVRPHEAFRVLDFLSRVMDWDTPAPAVVPTHDGGIQLEWHRAGLDVEVLFSGSDEDGLYVLDLRTREEWEGPPVEGFRRFALAERLREAAISVAG
jgi:hypothetical protein